MKPLCLVAIVFCCMPLVVRADPTSEAYARLRQKQEAREAATTQPVTKQDLDRTVADLQKEIEALRDEVQQLQQEVAKLESGEIANPAPQADPAVADAFKKALIVVGMTRAQVDDVLKRRGVTSFGGLNQSEQLVDGKSVKTEIIKLNPDKNYGILPTEIELENGVVVRVQGLHL